MPKKGQPFSEKAKEKLRNWWAINGKSKYNFPYKDIREYRRKYRQIWNKNNPEKYRAIRHRDQDKNAPRRLWAAKKLLFDHYTWYCNCCKEPNVKFLTIDHINNDGYKDLNKLGGKRRGGMALLQNVIKENFPKDRYQILCFNCNCGKGINKGICPHKEIQ